MFKHGFLITLASLIFTLLPTLAYADAAVWKVSKGEDYIYLGGTVHILPSSEFPLPKEFALAYQNSDSLVLETPLPDNNDPEFQAKMMQALSYSGEQTLSKVLSKETYQALSNYLQEFGVPLQNLDRFKPGFIVTMMAVMEAKRANIAGEGVDAYFNKLASNEQRTIEYLEPLEFQLQLMANMGGEDPESLIKSTLSEMDSFQQVFRQLIPAWRAGNTSALNDLIIKPMQQQDPITFKAMMLDRNYAWIPHIKKMFNDKDRELVLVGVGHLAGKDNVLALLEQQGFTVEKFEVSEE